MTRTFDRLPSLDPRRLENHSIRTLALDTRPLVSKTHPLAIRLDQGREGACVGFSWAHEMNSAPVRIGAHIVTYDFALGIYIVARRDNDHWYGEGYEGTSVDAGALTLLHRGYFAAYKWAQAIEDVMLAVAYEGPGVAGTWWKDGMFAPRPSGLMEVTGNNVGGHAWLIRGIVLKPKLKGETKLEPCLLLTNSWGRDWGLNGSAYMKVSDFERLLREDGEFCVPVGRKDPRIKPPVFS